MIKKKDRLWCDDKRKNSKYVEKGLVEVFQFPLKNFIYLFI